MQCPLIDQFNFGSEKHKKIWQITPEKIINRTLLAYSDYVTTEEYGGLLHFRKKKKDEYGDLIYVEEPCGVWYELLCSPYLGLCFEGCTKCFMQNVATIRKFEKARLAIFRKRAIETVCFPKKPKHIYIQSSFEAFHPKISDWMHEMVFEMMVNNSQHYWFAHTRAPETFVNMFEKNIKYKPEHFILGISAESDHNIRGFCLAASIKNRLKATEKLIKTYGVDVVVSIAPFFSPKDPVQFVRTLRGCGVTKVAICCDQNTKCTSNKNVGGTIATGLDVLAVLEEVNRLGMVAYLNKDSLNTWGFLAAGDRDKYTHDYVSWEDPRVNQYFKAK